MVMEITLQENKTHNRSKILVLKANASRKIKRWRQGHQGKLISKNDNTNHFILKTHQRQKDEGLLNQEAFNHYSGYRW